MPHKQLLSDFIKLKFPTKRTYINNSLNFIFICFIAFNNNELALDIGLLPTSRNRHDLVAAVRIVHVRPTFRALLRLARRRRANEPVRFVATFVVPPAAVHGSVHPRLDAVLFALVVRVTVPPFSIRVYFDQYFGTFIDPSSYYSESRYIDSFFLVLKKK